MKDSAGLLPQGAMFTANYDTLILITRHLDEGRSLLFPLLRDPADTAHSTQSEIYLNFVLYSRLFFTWQGQHSLTRVLTPHASPHSGGKKEEQALF